MAKRKCPFCAEKIQAAARLCKHCGRESAPVKTNPLVPALVLFGLLFACGVLWRGPSLGPVQPTSSVSRAAAVDASPKAQEQRKKLIQKLIDSGVFTKIEKPAQLPHAWTGPAWSELPFDQKQSFSNVVLAYYYSTDRKADMLILKNGRTGKRIGSFSGESGLDLD